MKTIVHLILVFSVPPCIHGDNNTMECAQCGLGESCLHKMTCAEAGMICASLEVANSYEGDPNGTYKGCIAPSSCAPVVLSMSVTTGTQVWSNMVCCATRGCNDNLTLSVPSSSSWKNGVYCPACMNRNSSLCGAQVDIPCTGAEEMCITLEGVSIDKSLHNFSMRGCATVSACALRENNLMSFGGEVYMLTRNATCKNRGNAASLPFLAALIFQVIVELLLANVLFHPSLSGYTSSPFKQCG